MRLSGRLICADAGEVALVRRHLPEHIRLTLAEPGCLGFSVVQSPEDPLVWQVEEEFVDTAAFDAHRQRTQGSDWFRATQAIARDYRLLSGET